MKLQQKLRGSLLHPKEVRGGFGCHFLIMSMSMAVLLDPIAEFLLFLADAPSFWFTLNTSYNHGLHLSRRFGLPPRDYECLLAAAKLAHYTKSGFTIKPKEWKMFLDGHYFAVVEKIDERKVELDKKNLYVERMIDRTQPGTKRSEFYVL